MSSSSSSSSSSTSDDDSRKETSEMNSHETKSSPFLVSSEYYSDGQVSTTPPLSPVLDRFAEDKRKKNFRYVYDFAFYDLTTCVNYLTIAVFRKVHLSVCRYMNACLKNLNFNLEFFISSCLKRAIRRIIFEIKFLISTFSPNEMSEAFRFWKVKRVQIAKVLLDCEDNKLSLSHCVTEVEKIISNGLCYASLKDSHSDKMYALCLLAKILYAISILDYKNKM